MTSWPWTWKAEARRGVPPGRDRCHVDIAYPFSALPTAFVVRLPEGGERYACCATDALGIAPMVGQRIEILSRCHHCGTALEFSATADGPAPEAAGVMLWVGERTEEGCKAADSL